MLQKFAFRLDAHVLDGLLFTLAASVNDDELDLIVDGTGMQPGNASYYCIRTVSLRRDSDGTEMRAIRHHIILTLIIDSRTLMIVSILTTAGPGSDAPRALAAGAGEDGRARSRERDSHRRQGLRLGSES